MPGTNEPTLVTASEFVTDLLCALALEDVRTLRLVETMEDSRFAEAFEMLREHQKELNVSLDFSLAPNRYHGDSSTLREAIYGLRERGVVSINNPSFKTVEIQVDSDDADYYLSRSSIRRDFLAEVVSKVFMGGLGEGHGERGNPITH